MVERPARMLPPHTPYRLLSDERLARLAARSDERAFSSLYLRHESALLAYCRSITRDPDDARDALQSAMASAYAAVPDRANGGPVRAWLFRIAHNESIDVLRRRRVDLPLVESDLTPAPSAADETARREAAHEALAEVAQLPPRQRGGAGPTRAARPRLPRDRKRPVGERGECAPACVRRPGRRRGLARGAEASLRVRTRCDRCGRPPRPAATAAASPSAHL